MASSTVEERGWTVRGQVQGVGFRWSARTKARSLDLDGWVRNEPDGTVSVRARGRADAMEAFERWLHEGPEAASVQDVERVEGGGAEPVEEGGFRIRH